MQKSSFFNQESMQFDNKIRMKIIIADRMMVVIKVCHTSHNPLKVANG
jgi:hypothetical protein